MPKMIILQGLPASGKSTYAKQLMKDDGNMVRVNKDLLRTMLHFNKFSGINEEITRKAERSIARVFLMDKEGKNVVVDDTNMNPRTLQSWKDFAVEMGVPYHVEKIDTNWRECVERDSVRPDSVGRDVIVGMARQFGVYDDSRRDIICDIDGTLCDITHRLPHIKKDPKDWESFFGEVLKDVPRQETIDKLIEFKKQGYCINLVSGRPERCKKDTLWWLECNKVPHDFLLMRRDNDKRDDNLVKQDFLNNYFKKENIDLVIDDRPRVIRMWQENGLKVDDVGDGVEF